MNNFNSTGLRKKELGIVKEVSKNLSIEKSKIIKLIKAGLIHPANKSISEFQQEVINETKNN